MKFFFTSSHRKFNIYILLILALISYVLFKGKTALPINDWFYGRFLRVLTNFDILDLIAIIFFLPVLIQYNNFSIIFFLLFITYYIVYIIYNIYYIYEMGAKFESNIYKFQYLGFSEELLLLTVAIFIFLNIIYIKIR